MYGDYDNDDEEDVELLQVLVNNISMQHIGIAKETGTIFVRGDLHPLGSASALLTAAAQNVPYIAVSAVEVLYPLDWLRGECAHNRERLRILHNLESWVRSNFSQGAAVRH